MTSAPRATSGALRAAGARWSLLIVREIDLGAQRFTSNQRRAGAPRNRVVERLRTLTAVGVVVRERCAGGLAAPSIASPGPDALSPRCLPP